jgi:crotonobetainyl-CoA:carnitine CoA-transferase CaiB-like acyl-CoA transferase
MSLPPDLPQVLPLAGLLVVDLSQFLAGPLCTLRLADLGARVIKIERPDGGDLTRRLYLSDTDLGGDSTLFHAINRGKESLALNLKDPADLAALGRLIARADVLVQNFRPGVMKRLGFDPDMLARLNPRLIQGAISGYGPKGPWADRPGQDLLAQARSGLMWLNGDADQGPVPFGLAVGDMLAGAALAQGILAALVRRGVTGQGMRVETSLLEALVDFQFEVLTTHLNDGRRPPRRAARGNAHAYLAAPYGVYRAADGWIAIAMTPLDRLARLMGIAGLAPWLDRPETTARAAFAERDAIRQVIAQAVAARPVRDWLDLLEPADIWCAEVLDWPALLGSPGFGLLDMLQEVMRGDGVSLATTRLPLRLDGRRPATPRAAPRIGEDSTRIRAEFGL